MYRSPFVSSLLATAVLLTACGGDDTTGPAPAAGERPAASVVQAEPSTSAPAETPGQGTDAAIVDAGRADAETPTTTSTRAPTRPPAQTPAGGTDARRADAQPPTQTPAGGTDAEGTSDDGSGYGVPSGGTEGLPGWPIESTPVHGGTFWAAYVAVGAPGDPALQPVLDDVQQLWPGAGLGELGCDEGAAAALGRSSGDHAVAVYFATEQHITEFRRRWEAPFITAVRVTTLCAD